MGAGGERRQGEEPSGVLGSGGTSSEQPKQEDPGHLGEVITEPEGADFFRRFLYSSRRSATSPRASSLSTIRARERLAVMFFMI